MYTYEWCENEDRELLERVSTYLNRELRVFDYHKTRVIESPSIMCPSSWRRDPGRASWDSIGKWVIQACFDYRLGDEQYSKIQNCTHDYLVGWRECKAHWDALTDAQEAHAELVRQNKEYKDLWKASFDPKQCLDCRNRVDCLPLDIKKIFREDKYHYNRDLACVFEARINHWDHKGQAVVEVYSRGGTWHEATRYYRSLNTNTWFTTNPRILEEMRRTVVYSERGYHPVANKIGVNFAWLSYDKPKEKRGK